MTYENSEPAVHLDMRIDVETKIRIEVNFDMQIKTQLDIQIAQVAVHPNRDAIRIANQDANRNANGVCLCGTEL
jgi:hypothetical protein